jgi:hypothetical protein
MMVVQQGSKAKSKKSEIDILDEKINKCAHETKLLEQKFQKEWSKHMRTKHLETFYDGKESTSDASEKPFKQESDQIEKNILKYAKKQQMYEKRKEKLLEQIEQDRQQQHQQQQQQQQQQNDRFAVIFLLLSCLILNQDVFMDTLDFL